MSIKAEQTYPNPQELFEKAPTLRNYHYLCKQIQQRWEEHATEYITPNRRTDGRYINRCMTADYLENITEEVIDAIFNTLVGIYRSVGEDKWLRELLDSLIGCWQMCNTLKNNSGLLL